MVNVRTVVANERWRSTRKGHEETFWDDGNVLYLGWVVVKTHQILCYYGMCISPHANYTIILIMIILIIAWILVTLWSDSFSPSLSYLHERAGHRSQGIGGGWQQCSSECHSLQESPPGPGSRVSPSWTHSTLSRPLFLPSHLAVTTVSPLGKQDPTLWGSLWSAECAA